MTRTRPERAAVLRVEVLIQQARLLRERNAAEARRRVLAEAREKETR